jgi:hypothetical protein
MAIDPQVLKLITQLIEKFNLLELNAKATQELPAQIALELNSLIRVSNAGSSQKISIQQIVDAVSGGIYNQLISIGTITYANNIVTIPAGAVWKIDNVTYTNLTIINISIAPTDAGNSRSDILVADTNNQIVLVSGFQSSGDVLTPPIPTNTVLVTQIQVNDTGVTETAPPNTGLNYVLKAESQPVNIGIVADEAAILNFISSNLNIVDHSGELNSINSDPQYLRNGKIYNIKNGLNVPLVITHLGLNGNIKFSFPNEIDFILQENEVVQFLYNQSTNQNPRLDFIGRISVGSNIDQTVAENSTNAVSGGGVFEKLASFKTANFLDLTSSAQSQIDSKQVKDSQIEVNGSTNVSNAWNGKTILVTASCTITIPATLLDQFMFVGRTLAGVTLTIAITAPFTFETAPTTITEKKTFSLIRRGNTNTILLDF